MSGALSAYKRIKKAAEARRGGVRLSFEECAAIYWGDQAVKDAIDNALAAAEEDRTEKCPTCQGWGSLQEGGTLSAHYQCETCAGTGHVKPKQKRRRS